MAGRKPSRRSLWPPSAAGWALLILAAGGTLTGWLYASGRDYEDAAAARQFRAEAQVLGRDVKDVLRRSAHLTNTAAALVRSLPRIDARSWHGFVSELKPFDTQEGLVGYAIAQQVDHRMVDGFSEQMRREGQGSARVFPIRGGGPYWPITYAEPRQLNQRAVGFDLGSEPNRRQALLQARDSGQAIMSGLVTVNFLGEAEPPPGYLVFYPIYFGDSPPTDTAERQARFQGLVLAAYRFDRLLDSIANSGHGRYALSLLDLAGEEPKLAYRSNYSVRTIDDRFRSRIDFTILDHSWRVEVAATQAYSRQVDRQRSTATLALGGFLTLAAASLFYFLSSGRQRAEALAEEMTAELRASEERFRALTKLSSDWYWEQDEEYRFTTIVVGDAAIAQGVPTAIGLRRWEMPIGLSDEEWQAHRATLDARQAFRDFEFPIRDEAGAWRWRAVNGEPMFAPDGRFVGYRGTGRDITERKEAEKQLALKSFALDQIHEQAYLFDADSRIIYLNGEACRALGYSRAELLTMSVFDFDPDITVETLAESRRRLEQVGHDHIESRHQRKDGTCFPVEINLTILSFDGREYVLTLVSDITERRHHLAEIERHRDHLQEMVAEQTRDLLAAKEAAERANRAKSEFLANVTHELRTPMHAILSYANLGRDRQERLSPEKIAGYFDRIRDSGERLLGLIDELLDLAKFEAGRMLLDSQSADAVELCRSVIADLASLAAAKMQKVELSAAPGTAAIPADPQRIAQVLRNLLANAIRFSPNGGHISLSVGPSELPGRRANDQGSIPALSITVADRGVGIPEAELDSIFDAFVQSSRTRSGAGGTGLGLAICRQIVHAHHGRIRAHNRAGGGALFEVLLPIR